MVPFYRMVGQVQTTHDDQGTPFFKVSSRIVPASCCTISMDDLLFEDGDGVRKPLGVLRAEYDRVTENNPAPLAFSEWLGARKAERKETIQMPAVKLQSHT